MNTQGINMVTPLDCAVFGLAFVSSTTLGVISGSSPLVAAIASAIILGFFGLLAKGLELFVKMKRDNGISYRDRRIKQLEAQLGQQKDR